jgi:hypothetical protein
MFSKTLNTVNIKLEKYSLSYRTLFDIYIFCVLVPLFLTTVFVTSLNKSFALYTADPTIYTIYFSNFAHAGVSHFTNNLTFYLFIISLILVLHKTLKIRTKKEFYYDNALIYLSVPFAVSLYNVKYGPVNNIDVSLGFSGIVSALNGYLVALLFIFIYTHTGTKLTKLNYVLSSVIFFNLLLLMNFKYKVESEYTTLLIFLIIFCLLNARKDITHILSFVLLYTDNNMEFKNIYIEYVFFTLVVLFGGMVMFLIVLLWFAMFPDNIRTETGSTVNIVGHYLGYCIGIFIPWFIHLIQISYPHKSSSTTKVT